MSGLYIPGMEMPKDFTDVRIYADGRVISRTLLSFGEEIATAVPVPNHGRLIDGDRAEKELAFDYAYAAAKMVKEMPTVIPADKEDA